MTWHEYADQHRPDLFQPLEQLIDSMPRTIPPIHQHIHQANRWVDRVDRWIAPVWCWLADRIIPTGSYTNLSPPVVGVPVGQLLEATAPVSGLADTTRTYAPNCILDALPWHRCRTASEELAGPFDRCYQSDVDMGAYEQFAIDHPQWGDA